MPAWRNTRRSCPACRVPKEFSWPQTLTKVYITRGGVWIPASREGTDRPKKLDWPKSWIRKVGLAKKLDSKSWIGQKVGFTKLGWPKGWIRKVGFKKLGWPQSWVGKSSFSTGFIRFCDMAKCHVVYSEKPNAFWSFWRPFCVLGSKMIGIR